jgi:hypothetical protein
MEVLPEGHVNRHVQAMEEYVMHRGSSLITGLFVVSLITAPVLWAAGTGGTGSGTGGTGSGTIEQPGGRGTSATGGTGAAPTLERPGSGTGGTGSSTGERGGTGGSGDPGSGTGTVGSSTGSMGSDTESGARKPGDGTRGPTGSGPEGAGTSR